VQPGPLGDTRVKRETGEKRQKDGLCICMRGGRKIKEEEKKETGDAASFGCTVGKEERFDEFQYQIDL